MNQTSWSATGDLSPTIIQIETSKRIFTSMGGILVLLGWLAPLENQYHMSMTIERRAGGLSELHNYMLDHIYLYAKQALRHEV